MPDRLGPLFRFASLACYPLTLAGAQQFLDTLPPRVGFYYAPNDLDGDALPDLVSALDPVLRLHRNDGHNRFGSGVSISNLPGAQVGTLADFDGDGDRDMVVFATSATAAPAIAVYLVRNGGATFTTTSVFQPPSMAPSGWMLQAVDLDNDGDQDLVCTLATALLNTIYHVLENDGTGQFTDVSVTWLPPYNFPTPPFGPADDAHVIDVDLDGRLDLLFDLRGLRLWRNTGTTFVDETAARLPPVAAQARWSAVGDIDGDGDLDVFATPEAQLPMLLSNTGGVFTDVTATQLAALPPMAQPAFFDADRDGDVDLYVRGAQPLLLANDGAGNFLNAVPAPAFGPEVTQISGSGDSKQAIAVVDVELDGDADLVLADRRIGVLRSDGAGNLVDPWASTRFAVSWAVTMDFDSDGDDDILTPEGIRANDGFGGFALLPYVGTPPAGHGAVIGDLDLDGDADFVSDQVYLNQGGGAFSAGPISGPVGQVYAKTLADLDGDVDLDLALLQTLQGPRLYLNNGSGAFTFTATLPIGPVLGLPLGSIDAADADGDSDLDLVIAAGGTIFVLEQQGPANFVLVASTPGSWGTRWVSITGGLPDIIVHPTSRVFRLQAGTLIDITATVLPFGGQFGLNIYPGDVDGDGDIDVCGQRLFRNNGAGAFTPELLGVSEAAPAGLHDFDLDGDLDALVRESAFTYLCWNREHHVALPLPAHTGRPLRLDVSARPGFATPLEFAVIGIGLTRLAPGIPLPFGQLRIGSIGLTLGIAITPVTGLTELDLPIPPNPAFVGIDLHFQALHIGPSAWLLGNVASTRIE